MSTKQRYYLAGFIFVVLGIFLAIQGGMEFSRARASENWPDTMGTISESEVIKETHTHTDISRRDTDTYEPVVHYNYSVDGYQYSSDRILFGDTTYAIAFWKAHDYVDEFPEGEQVPVYYDPANPQRSVLKPGVYFETYFSIILGVILIWFASAIFLKGAKQED